MAICEKCNKRDNCKKICPTLQKELSARGISRRMKEKTYAVDFNLLETNESLNSFQLEVRRRIVHDTFIREITGIDLQDLIQKNLSGKEKRSVQLLLEGYSQRKIASTMKISQTYVNIFLRRAIWRLKKYISKK